jgi:hypothetical protein
MGPFMTLGCARGLGGGRKPGGILEKPLGELVERVGKLVERVDDLAEGIG